MPEVRGHLRRAGIDRPELFESSDIRLQIRLHDLRATFITIKLANGRTETWISDRTGHKSSTQINNYHRAARTVAELGLGDFAPLDEAIPEFREGAAAHSSGATSAHDGAGSATARGHSGAAEGGALGPRWANREDAVRSDQDETTVIPSASALLKASIREDLRGRSTSDLRSLKALSFKLDRRIHGKRHRVHREAEARGADHAIRKTG
jgi:hypothetical protein